jgi:hypothetical protein
VTRSGRRPVNRTVLLAAAAVAVVGVAVGLGALGPGPAGWSVAGFGLTLVLGGGTWALLHRGVAEPGPSAADPPPVPRRAPPPAHRPPGGRPSDPVAPASVGPVSPVEDPEVIALRDASPEDVRRGVAAGQRALVEQWVADGELSGDGPLSDGDVGTMVFLAVSTEELLEALLGRPALGPGSPGQG